ncbi:ATP-binding protein [Dactylosporangium fulvum]|uniref:histidine kinase n=1 Tax=Dactylosporangium fulvum TaxID=53359 RepID=A0ABY5VZ35_9ACTN|nr:nitrate- and nitrite sensing domain-containing protein [Dactylosporangium fulvum]UWP82400.1 nitrate- and nitrite sensing domain-containing protein [Dactylosporangium fulvum]
MASNRRGGRQRSIKRRIIRLVLVPGVVAVTLWLVASGYLVFQGWYNREVANGVRKVSIPAVSALASIQQERRLSVGYLSQPSRGVQELLEQRQQTDQRLAELRTVADAGLANAPQSIVTRWKAVTGFLDQLPGVRSTIDAKSADAQDAYDFYNQLLDAATALFDTQARMVPDATATKGGIAATEVWRASDLMSRAGSAIEAAFGARALSDQDHLAFVNMVGAYRFGLTTVAPHLQPEVRQRYEDVTASDAWKQLVAAENAIIASGPWRNGVPRTLPVDAARWQALTRQVSDQLIDLTVLEADQVSAQTLRTGNNQLLAASLGSLIALCVAIGAILWAVRQSQVLVDQGLSVRLARLGRDAAETVDQRLPAMMDRLRRREPVDLEVELPTKDYGSDEIGQVADVINRSLHVAAGAAVDEAKTRAAGTAMLMGVARRPQRPLQRGLQVIEGLQKRIGDEEVLPQLFDIHHQLNQTRRFLENLVILAGGQIGRRFKNPVPLRRVLLAAFAETQHYQRITLRDAPDVALVGPAIAGTVHLLAELLDNALAFSPPTTTVWVTCVEVPHGVAVEIEDAGVGMNAEAVERANELLATAPTPDVTELKGGTQVGLYVVAELAKRDGVQVSIRRSAYGGLLAIVLLPERVLVTTGSIEPEVSDVPESPAALAAERIDTGIHPAVTRTARPDDIRRYDLRPAAGVATVAAAPTASTGSIPEPREPHVVHAAAHRRADLTGGVRSSDFSNGSAVAPRQRASSAAYGVGTEPPNPQAATRPVLPHRQPQQHLAPELREEDTPDTRAQGATAAKSPEDVRDRYTRYQRGRSGLTPSDGRTASNGNTFTSADQGGEA